MSASLRHATSPAGLFLSRPPSRSFAQCTSPVVRSKQYLTVRPLSTASPSAVVSDEVIARLAAQPLHPLTLADLVRHGRPPLSPDALYQTANFALSILPARLAHRIQSMRNLPYIVVTNPHISQIHDNYMHSLSTLLPFAERQIVAPEEEERFTEVMAGLVQTHTNTIPIMARGFLESRKYISPAAVTSFLDEHLRARIGTRLIAEQHIALHYSSVPHPSSPVPPQQPNSYIGIIDTALQPATIISTCESFVAEICELRYGVRPHIIINGEPDTCIAHVPVHLEYILTELLKNAFRAVIERGNEREPIEVTIAPSPQASPTITTKQPGIRTSQQGDGDASGGPSGSTIAPLEAATPGVTIRIRDRGGGISPENYANLWNYGFTTFNEHEASDATSSGMDALSVISGAGAGGSSLAGLGYGLPLGRAYAEYFGGGIAVQSLWGWGTDVYLSLRGVGKVE